MLKHLKHPRVMKMLEYFPSKKCVLIVTEYISNGTLLQLIDDYNDQLKKFSQEVCVQYRCLVDGTELV